MNLDGLNFEFSLTGEGFIIFSGLSAAMAAGFVKVFSKHENTTTLCGWQFFCGGLALVIIGAATGGSIRPTSGASFAMLFYLAFLSGLRVHFAGVPFKVQPRFESGRVQEHKPAVRGAVSAIILGQKQNSFCTNTTLIALALVCGGILIINLLGEKRLLLRKGAFKRACGGKRRHAARRSVYADGNILPDKPDEKSYGELPKNKAGKTVKTAKKAGRTTGGSAFLTKNFKNGSFLFVQTRPLWYNSFRLNK